MKYKRTTGEVLKQVCKLSEGVLQNQLIITCRIASQHYQLEDSLIEIVDLARLKLKPLLKVVCRRWQKSQRERLAKAAQFMQKLQLSEIGKFVN